MASSRIRGITIEIDGDATGLDQALSDVNSRSRDLHKELQDVNRLLKFNPGNAELIAQKQQLLGEQIENTTKKLEQLKEAEEEVQRQFENGEIGADQFRAFQREIIATEGRLEHFQNELDSLGAGDEPGRIARGMEKIESAARGATKAVGGLARGIGTASKAAAGISAAGVAGIAGLVEGTEDYNRSLARLKANANNVGFNYKPIKEGMLEIAAVSGDTEAAVETVSNLIQTGFDENQLADAIDLVNGAAIRFSDTLNTEGIADGIQETFATGEAAGSFAELLERSEVSLETFNAGLAKAKKNGDETNYVLEQLSSLGLASAYEEYKKLNPELVANHEANLALKDALAELSITLTPLMTFLTTLLTALVDWVNKNAGVIKSLTDLEGKSGESTQKIIQFVRDMLTKMIEFIVQNLPQFYQKGLEILNVVQKAFIELIPDILSLISKLLIQLLDIFVDNLPNMLRNGKELLLSLIKGLQANLPLVLDKIVELVAKMGRMIWDHRYEILEAGAELILALLKGIVSVAQSLQTSIESRIVQPIFKKIAKIPKEAYRIGKDLISGLVNGITDTAYKIYNKAKSIASYVIRTLQNAFDTHSPSRITTKIGEYVGQGLANGIGDMENAVGNASKRLANAATMTLNADLNKQQQLGFNKDNMASVMTAVMKGMPENIVVQSILNGRVIAESITNDVTGLQVDRRNRAIRQLNGGLL
ncbi:phage-related minor tail protein [Cytobacillus firmus]|uniref:Phage-related minor tail protein n=2 Tax=Cytobacillus TaxID=2675230 RepID=A0A366JN93_CYTFI|nr:hypothetical protein [Cytobacillus oceanisediminis]RBP89400.1 phage-related minor tail protein [Cytobacillus firmus]TDX47373.1 phage-related minor tail protein [Cytobacillus oceanisediminis]